MNCKTDQPLVTLLLLTYNQEAFVDEAVAGALSQTYSPLEILISDDCSSDGTFDAIRKRVDLYTGPHHVRVVRNETNLGIGRHINKLMELANGELIVASAGDDVSLPERVRTLVSRWTADECNTDMIHSQVTTISAAGDVIEVSHSVNRVWNGIDDFISANVIIGASEAWTKRLFNRFGPLAPEVVHEDRALGFRALLGGGISFVDIPLVKYRLGGISQISHRNGFDILYTVAKVTNKRYRDDYSQNHTDLMLAAPNEESNPGLASNLVRRIRYHEARYKLACGEGVVKTLINYGVKEDPHLLVEGVKYSLPWVYAGYTWLKARF